MRGWIAAVVCAACSDFSAVEANTGPDASVDAPVDAATEADGGARANKLVFLTFARIPSGGGPAAMRQRADQACNTEAAMHRIGGTYVAWLSTSTSDAIDVLVPANGPWLLPGNDAVRVFQDRAAVFMGKLDHEIDRYPDGTRPAPGLFAWTGTQGNGRASVSRCDDWSATSAGAGTVGDPTTAKDNAWTAKTTAVCDESYAVVCFEK